MLKYIRYTLAALCLAASVGCFLLWWRSMTVELRYLTITGGFILESECGMGKLVSLKESLVVYEGPDSYGWKVRVLRPRDSIWYEDEIEVQGSFGYVADFYFFPLWFPALVFAITGVGFLRLGRFTLRSAIIATTVVAGLLGMAVTL